MLRRNAITTIFGSKLALEKALVVVLFLMALVVLIYKLTKEPEFIFGNWVNETEDCFKGKQSKSTFEMSSENTIRLLKKGQTTALRLLNEGCYRTGDEYRFKGRDGESWGLLRIENMRLVPFQNLNSKQRRYLSERLKKDEREIKGKYYIIKVSLLSSHIPSGEDDPSDEEIDYDIE